MFETDLNFIAMFYLSTMTLGWGAATQTNGGNEKNWCFWAHLWRISWSWGPMTLAYYCMCGFPRSRL